MTLPGAADLLFDLGLSQQDFDIQLAQTEFRRRIVTAWDIPEGWNVLEIGCGQHGRFAFAKIMDVRRF